jgi:ribosome maturation factor RimP
VTAKIAKLAELIAPLVEDLSFEFWGVEFQTQKDMSLLRVYIESTDDEGGISVDDCAKVSRELSLILDVEEPIKTHYRLEVSSPGMERPLFTLAQYQRYVGHQIKLKLRFAFEGRKKFNGQLVAIENDELQIQDGEFEYCLPFETVQQGRLVPQFS